MHTYTHTDSMHSKTHAGSISIFEAAERKKREHKAY